MVIVFKYLDYRKFLMDIITEKKSANKNFSYRVFSRLCGFKSTNFIMLVVQGKRNLSDDGIVKIYTGLKLKKREREYFRNLVHFNQAKTDSEKKYYFSQIRMSYERSDSLRLKEWQYEYYSKWFIPVIHEMVLLEGFSEDVDWIAEKLNWKVHIRDIKRALKVLIELKLIRRDKDGRLAQAHPHISSGDDIASLNINKFQTEMITKAADSINELSEDEREIGSVTFAISDESLEEAKEMIRDFRSKLASFLSEDKKQNKVCQFNVQLFSLTSKIDDRKVKGEEKEEV